jgi:hypothetical protein
MIDCVLYSTSHSIIYTECMLLVLKWDLMSSEIKLIQPYFNQLFSCIKLTSIIDSKTVLVFI